MTKFQKITLVSLRIALGWMFFYAGITKVLSGNFSAAGYLQGAKTFSGFYDLFLNPQILPVVNFLNEWGLTLVGASLILGVFTRLSSIVGALLLMLYYFPILDFPYPDAHSFIVDSHVLEALAVLVVGAFKAGRVFGLENWCSNLPICRKWYATRNWLG
jgi:thiosulfate dehydrogenase [quinone] large subunit